jgi:hypothetical protein
MDGQELAEFKLKFPISDVSNKMLFIFPTFPMLKILHMKIT